MKIIKCLILVFVMLPTISCKQKTEKASIIVESQPIDAIHQYYAKAEKLKLPLTWINTGNKLPVGNSKIIKIKEKDTLLFGSEAPQLTLLGVIPDTSKFFTFLFYYPADDLLPVMMTFNKTGKKIDQLKTGYNCGADCGYYCVGGAFTLKKDLSFLSQHTSYQANCNDEQMDTTTVTFYVLERKGKILSNGKFTEGENATVEKLEMPFTASENPLNQTE